MTIFGCSARYLAALEEQHASPRTHNKLDTVHTILSTGSPLHGQVFEYIYKEIKENVLLGSITGGTDIMYVIRRALSLSLVRTSAVPALPA